jgi:hypothetical protein
MQISMRMKLVTECPTKPPLTISTTSATITSGKSTTQLTASTTTTPTATSLSYGYSERKNDIYSRKSSNNKHME